MKVLELGNYISVAYAGMILAEQGATVTKWHVGRDPILSLQDGDDLWKWINAGKRLVERDISTFHDMDLSDIPDVIIDNFRPQTLEKWGIDPAKVAAWLGCVWVSLRSEVGEVSFDMVAQCRSWLEYGPYVPFYVGDTTAGLWMAFKALAQVAQGTPGHFCIGQASCMQKLVEGELILTPTRNGFSTPWDAGNSYYYDGWSHEGVVDFRGTTYREPVRNRAWKLAHLWHDQGRIRI